MSPPRVAVIVRTKDRPAFLERALQSIAAQTLPDWECVIVNDGGDSAVVEDLVSSLDASTAARIRIVGHTSPKGRWRSANAGVLATTAPLLVLHDDDDSWHPEFLERATTFLDDHPARDGVVSRIDIVWERRVGDGFETIARERFQPALHDVTLSDTLLYNRFVPIGFVYRRALHADLGLYDEELPVIGDWAFNLKVLARGPLPFLEGPAYAYWHQRTDAAAADGNSVIAASGDHARYDALVRDAALRDAVDRHGLGLVLYLTKFIDQRFVDVENGIRSEIENRSTLDRIRRRIRRRRQ